MRRGTRAVPARFVATSPSPYDQGVLHRRLASLLVTVSAAGLLAAGCGSDQAAALRVGDQTFSNSEIEDDLDAYAENELINPDGDAFRGATAESFDQAMVSQVLEQRLIFTLEEQIFDDEGLSLDDEARQAAVDSLSPEEQQMITGFPDDYREWLVDGFARRVVLQDELGADELNQALVALADEVDIEVSSRFGSWDADAYSVVPPDGPADAPGATATTDATDPLG